MTCPHRVVREVRVYPGSDDEFALVMGVACEVALTTRAPVAVHDVAGRGRAWVLRGGCAECEAEA